jgi:predicted nucleic acid-binding protein
LILVDTSAWIENIRGTRSVIDRRLIDLIASESVVATTQPVVMEILQGARSAEHAEQLVSILNVFRLIAFDPDIDFENAAAIYRGCRDRGHSVHSLDCMIASVALRHDAAILSGDADFAKIASVVPLRLDPATPR